MSKNKEIKYRIVVKHENGYTETITTDDNKHPLDSDTCMEELQTWQNEMLFDTSIESVRAYEGNKRIG